MPYIHMNQPWVYECSPSWNSFPLLFPSSPSGSSQCTSHEHPVSCIKPGLVIYFTYDNKHVSMFFSQIITPSPSATECKSLFFISVSLFCLAYKVIVTIFLNSIYIYIYIYVNILYCFSFWLTSLWIIRSSFIHLIRTDSNALFSKAQ